MGGYVADEPPLHNSTTSASSWLGGSSQQPPFEKSSRVAIRIFFLNIFIGVIGELYETEKERFVQHLGP